MDLEVRDLELLEALGQHATLTAAAAALYVSQPALSQRLTKLEHRLGIALFDRVGRGLVPTRAGHRALRAARTTLTDLRHAERDLRAIRDGRRAPVVITSQCTANYAWVAPILADYRATLPGSEIRIDADAADDPVDALLDGRLDLALVSKLDARMDRLQLERLFDDELLTLVGHTHAWADRADPIALTEFAEEHLVLFEAYDPARRPSVPLPLPLGTALGALSTPPITTDVLIELVATGTAITVLPSWVAEPYLAAGQVVRASIDAPAQLRTWYAATRQCARTEPVETLTRILTDTLRPAGPSRLTTNSG